jgi:hypothetical protein
MLILKCLLILTSLITTFSQGSDFGGACSVYCSSCKGSPINNNLKYNHCSACAGSFFETNESSTDDIANCSVNTNDYQ